MGFKHDIYGDPSTGHLIYYFGDFSEGVGEEFADMFVALVLDYSPTKAQGASPLYVASGNFRRGFMETSMPVWLSGGSSTPPGNIYELYPWP